MTVKEQLAAIITVPAFKAWLATKDPADTYNYGDNQDCAVAQFLKASPEFQALINGGDGADFGVGGDYVRVGPQRQGDLVKLPREIEQAVWAKSRTFGEVLAILDARDY